MSQRFGYLTCFTTGLIVLVLELLAFRVLAPYFGTSSYVIGAIINTILLALSVGYWLGGYCVDRYQSARLPYWVILACAVYMTAIYLYYPQLLRLLAGQSVIFGSFVAIALMFFVPMVLLAFVPPYLIKLLLVARHEGRTSGMVFSIGTLGSIAGGLLTTFYLIPQLGSQLSLQLSVAVLYLLAAAGLVRGRLAYAPLALLALAPLTVSPPPLSPGAVYQGESEYNVATVSESYGRKLLLLNDNLGIQSVSLNPETKLAEYFYTDDFLLPLMLRPVQRTLILGNAAGTTMGSIAHHFDSAVDGVEIDPLITELGRRYFDLDPDHAGHRVIHQDGRRFLRDKRDVYQVIIVDMYGGGPYIPFHVATLEFFQDVAAALTDDGILVINLPFFAEQSELQRYYLNTIGRVFPHAWRVDQVLYASTVPLSKTRLEAALARQPPPLQKLAERLRDKLRPVPLPADAEEIFSDDHSPIDTLTFSAISAEWLAAERAARLQRLGY